MASQRPNKQGEKDTGSSSKDKNLSTAMAQSQPIERQIIMTNVMRTTIGLVIATFLLYFYIPIPVPSLPSTTHRLLYTLRLQTPAFIILMASILNVGTIRLATPAIDPINGNSEHYVLFAGRYLSNHVEQMLLNVPAQLVLASFLNEAQMKIIPILVLFFVFGRITFYIGYKQSYLKRSVGFCSTFIPSCIVWMFNVYFVTRALIKNEAI